MMVSDLKGQAALEFLMTYGWVIFIVVIALIVLTTSGVFSPESWMTNSDFNDDESFFVNASTVFCESKGLLYYDSDYFRGSVTCGFLDGTLLSEVFVNQSLFLEVYG